MSLRDLRELGENLRAERSVSPALQRQVEAAKQIFGCGKMSLREELKAVIADSHHVADTHADCDVACFLRDHGQALLEALKCVDALRYLASAGGLDGEPDEDSESLCRAKSSSYDILLDAEELIYGTRNRSVDTARSKTVDGGGV